jgi:hypothetical protein
MSTSSIFYQAGQLVKQKIATEISQINTGATGYTQSIGNGSATTIDVTHGLNSNNIIFSIRDIATNEFIYTDTKILTGDTLQLTFDGAPTTNQYSVTVISTDGTPGSTTPYYAKYFYTVDSGNTGPLTGPTISNTDILGKNLGDIVEASIKWVSGTDYSAGDTVVADADTFRANNDITNSTTGPSSDSTNWTRISSLIGEEGEMIRNTMTHLSFSSSTGHFTGFTPGTYQISGLLNFTIDPNAYNITNPEPIYHILYADGGNGEYMLDDGTQLVANFSGNDIYGTSKFHGIYTFTDTTTSNNKIYIGLHDDQSAGYYASYGRITFLKL